MRGLPKIAVEPLSEQRWSKVERGLFARVELEGRAVAPRPPKSRNPALLGLAFAAVVSGLVMTAYLVNRSPVAAAVEQPSRITTGSTASHLALPGLSLSVEPESAVVVGADTPQGLLIVVDRGSIACDVAPRPDASPLVVQAGAARVRVVGTRFRVSRLNESARVTVQAGVVEVGSAGRTVLVHAGEEWTGDEREARTAGTVATAEDALPLPRDSVESSTAATPRRAATALPVRRTVSPQPIETVAPTPVEPSRQAIFEQATALERSNPSRAIELYRKLDSGGDSWAQNSLYARGRLEASRGNRGEARRLLERYLERFPRGTNAEDARAELQRLR